MRAPYKSNPGYYTPEGYETADELLQVPEVRGSVSVYLDEPKKCLLGPDGNPIRMKVSFGFTKERINEAEDSDTPGAVWSEPDGSASSITTADRPGLESL